MTSVRVDMQTAKSTARKLAATFFGTLKSATGYTPPERIFRHLHFVGPFPVEMPNGQEITLYSWGHVVENRLAWCGWAGHEPAERKRWASMVADGGDILDIGANTATFAITAKAISPQSRVFAFEPLTRVADMARKNVSVSGLDVPVVCAALAREEGELPIFDPGGDNAYSASLDPDFLTGQKQSYQVPVLSLDGFCTEHGLDPSAVKLDVEGYEGEVICGAADVLRRGRCIFLCEWLGKSASHEEARRLLRDSAYSALDLYSLREIDLKHSKTHEERNILLVPDRRVDEVRRDWPGLDPAEG